MFIAPVGTILFHSKIRRKYDTYNKTSNEMLSGDSTNRTNENRASRGFKLSQNPHLLYEPRYETIQTDLDRKVGIFEKRGKFSALSKFWTKGTPGVHRLAGKPLPLARCEPRLHYFNGDEKRCKRNKYFCG